MWMGVGVARDAERAAELEGLTLTNLYNQTSGNSGEQSREVVCACL